MLQENNWGGGDSLRKAALLEEEVITLFRTKKEIYKDEVRATSSTCRPLSIYSLLYHNLS